MRHDGYICRITIWQRCRITKGDNRKKKNKNNKVVVFPFLSKRSLRQLRDLLSSSSLWSGKRRKILISSISKSWGPLWGSDLEIDDTPVKKILEVVVITQWAQSPVRQILIFSAIAIGYSSWLLLVAETSSRGFRHMFSVRALGTGYVPTGCTDRELPFQSGWTPFFAWGHVILSGLDAHLNTRRSRDGQIKWRLTNP